MSLHVCFAPATIPRWPSANKRANQWCSLMRRQGVVKQPKVARWNIYGSPAVVLVASAKTNIHVHNLGVEGIVHRFASFLAMYAGLSTLETPHGVHERYRFPWSGSLLWIKWIFCLNTRTNYKDFVYISSIPVVPFSDTCSETGRRPDFCVAWQSISRGRQTCTMERDETALSCLLINHCSLDIPDEITDRSPHSVIARSKGLLLVLDVR